MAGIGHRGFMGRSASSFCPYLPGLYTEEEIDDLVFIDGYIPVYDADEFDKIRTGAIEFMGGCTKWGGNYTTGADKKYVQVGVCDFASFASWTAVIDNYTGIYDGNEIAISNLSGTVPLFNCGEAKLQNIYCFNVSISATSGRPAAITQNIRGGLVDNCYVSGVVTTTGNDVAGVIGGNALLALTNDLIISNCINDADISGGIRVAGIISTGAPVSSAFTCTINNCINNGTITASNDEAAGIVNRSANLIIQNCTNNGDVTGLARTSGILSSIVGNNIFISCVNNGNINGTDQTGGIVGDGRTEALPLSTFEKCVNNGNVTGNIRVGGIAAQIDVTTVDECKNTGNISGTEMVGGIFANLENDSSTFSTLSNIESSGLITNSGSETGGLIGRIRFGGNIINNSISRCTFAGSTTLRGGIAGRQSAGTNTTNATYWDITIGPATSVAGVGKTTAELQTPTSNTGIYANYDPAIWDFGTSSEYPKLTTIP